jgi:hypothetical protein
MDSATEFLFGESIDSLGAGDKQPSFAKNFNTSQEGLAIRSRLGPLMIFHRDRAFSKATVEARRFVDQFVQKALDYRAAYVDGKDTAKAQEQRYVFIYELSKQTADRTVLTDQLLNILLAGRDTTAGILSITFFILARRPEIWNRLRDEVLKVQGERPSFEELKSMTYLSWVLNESKFRFLPTPEEHGSGYRTCNKEMAPRLKFIGSLEIVSRRASQLADGEQRHLSPSWRWPGRHTPYFCSQGTGGDIQRIQHASSPGSIWTGRDGISSGKMGQSEARMGLYPIQWRAKDLSGPAVCLNRSQLYHHAYSSAIQEY